MGTKRKLFSAWLTAVAVLFALAACETPEPEPPQEPDLSDKASLQHFSFTTSDNPTLETGSAAVLANDYYCITVPEGADRSRLVPSISVSEGAAVFIDDQPFEKGRAYDFSGNVQQIKSTGALSYKNGKYSFNEAQCKFDTYASTMSTWSILFSARYFF